MMINISLRNSPTSKNEGNIWWFWLYDNLGRLLHEYIKLNELMKNDTFVLYIGWYFSSIREEREGREACFSDNL